MGVGTDTLSAAQAQELAKTFHDLSVAVGNYRFKNWNALSNDQRQQLENQQWTLLNYSSDFTWTAIGKTLSDLRGTLANISAATDSLKSAIATVQSIGKVLKIVTAAVALAAAIGTGQAVAIATAGADLANAVAS